MSTEVHKQLTNGNQQQDQEPAIDNTQDEEIAAMFADDPGPPDASDKDTIASKEDAIAQPAGDGKDKPDDKGVQDTGAEAAKQKAEGKDLEDKGQPAGQKSDGDAAAKADDKAKQEPAAGSPPDPESVFKVVTSKGAKEVKAKDLVTTYQQFENLQQQHLNVKPILDFARAENMPHDLIWPIFAYGFEAYRRDMAAGNQPGERSQQQQAHKDPDQYAGPFKDAKEEAYFKDRDPDMFGIITRQHQQMQDLMNQVRQLSGGGAGGQTPPLYRQPPGGQRQADQQTAQKMEAIRQDFNQKIEAWTAGYSDYFKPDPATGKSERLDAFLVHLGEFYDHWRVSELTNERLSAAFAGFDPAFYNQTIADRAAAKEKELRDQNRQMFAEGGDVRSPGPQLSEQEQEIADMFAEYD